MNTGIQDLQMRMGDVAASLYDGGWRAADREQLIEWWRAADREQMIEYTLTEDEADAICKLLAEYENADKEE
ncbi:MAG: hypothetical protein WCS18_10760 [Sphaerochaetaceae bacterium]